MAQETRYLKANFHFENFPDGMPEMVRRGLVYDYVNSRGEIVDIVNRRLAAINAEWDKTGKPAAFGDYAEDINPEYTEFINSHFTDDIARINTKHLVKCYMGEYSEIYGTLDDIPGCKIYVTLSND